MYLNGSFFLYQIWKGEMLTYRGLYFDFCVDSVKVSKNDEEKRYLK